MPILKWDRLIGQGRVKSVIGQAFGNGTLGHAYLFCGERGTGKFAAAVDLAMALLCRHEEVRPCGECAACRKVGAYSHPDFHVIMPLVLLPEHKKDGGSLSDEGWALAAAATKRRLGDPYRLPQYGGIPNIPVDWIREAMEAVMRGGNEGPANVVIIDGVEAMNDKSANAMLKTLEEPPPGTVIILLTDKQHAVLPTILSRCQIMRFALLPPDVVRLELYRRLRAGTLGAAPEEPGEDAGEIEFVKKDVRKSVADNDLFGNDLFGNDLFAGTGAAPSSAKADAGANINAKKEESDPTVPPDPRIEAACHCGSIGEAMEEFGEALEESYEAASSLWNGCLCGDWEAATLSAERLAGGDDALSSCQKTLSCLIQLLRFAFFRKFGASMNYISVGAPYQIGLPETAAPADAERYVRLCQGALGSLKARGNVTLAMVNFACTLMEMLNGEEQ